MNLINFLSIPPNFRRIYPVFVDICEQDGIAAVLLDHFIFREQATDEAISQGEESGKWYALSSSYAKKVIYLPASTNKIRQSIQRLVRLSFIQPHPDNARRTGLTPQYRLNIVVLRAAIQRWNEAQEYGFGTRPSSNAKAAGAENATTSSNVINLPTSSNLITYPVKSDHPTLSNLITLPDQICTHKEVVEEESKRTTTTTTEAAASGLLLLSSNDSIQLPKTKSTLHDFMGKNPSKTQCMQLVDLWREYGEAAVTDAITIAADADKRTLAYVKGILKNKAEGKTKAGTPAPRKFFVASPDEPEGSRMTAEEMRAKHREFKRGCITKIANEVGVSVPGYTDEELDKLTTAYIALHLKEKMEATKAGALQ